MIQQFFDQMGVGGPQADTYASLVASSHAGAFNPLIIPLLIIAIGKSADLFLRWRDMRRERQRREQSAKETDDYGHCYGLKRKL